jgi:hypothetical protein
MHQPGGSAHQHRSIEAQQQVLAEPMGPVYGEPELAYPEDAETGHCQRLCFFPVVKIRHEIAPFWLSLEASRGGKPRWSGAMSADTI